MGKRLFRIRQEEINDKISQLLQKELNIVLKNALTLCGRIEKVQNNTIIFKDLLRRKRKIPFSEIEEIITDQESNY